MSYRVTIEEVIENPERNRSPDYQNVYEQIVDELDIWGVIVATNGFHLPEKIETALVEINPGIAARVDKVLGEEAQQQGQVPEDATPVERSRHILRPKPRKAFPE